MKKKEITGSMIFEGKIKENHRVVDFKGLRGRCYN